MQSLSDQKALAIIAKTDSDSDIREAAIQNLTNQSELLNFALNDTDENVRRMAVQNLTDQAKLRSFAENDLSEKVRITAVTKIKDQSILAHIAKAEQNDVVRLAVVKRLEDKKLLAEIALVDEATIVRKAATCRIGDQKLLAEIAMADEATSVREAAVCRIEDQAILADIAKHDPSEDIRMLATGRCKGPIQKEFQQLNEDDSYTQWAILLHHIESGNPTAFNCIADSSKLAVLIRYFKARAAALTAPKLTYYVMQDFSNSEKFPILIATTGTRSEFDTPFDSEKVREKVVHGEGWEALWGSGSEGRQNFPMPGCHLETTAYFDEVVRSVRDHLYVVTHVIPPDNSQVPEPSARLSNGTDDVDYEPDGRILHAVVRSERGSLQDQVLSECLAHFLDGMPSPSSNVYQERYTGVDWDKDREEWDEDEDAYAIRWVNDLIKAGKIPAYDLSKCEYYINVMARDYQTDSGLAILGIRVEGGGVIWESFLTPAGTLIAKNDESTPNAQDNILAPNLDLDEFSYAYFLCFKSAKAAGGYFDRIKEQQNNIEKLISWRARLELREKPGVLYPHWVVIYTPHETLKFFYKDVGLPLEYDDHDEGGKSLIEENSSASLINGVDIVGH